MITARRCAPADRPLPRSLCRVEPLGKLSLGILNPPFDRRQRHAERFGDLLAAETLPVPEDERQPLARWELQERSAETVPRLRSLRSLEWTDLTLDRREPRSLPESVVILGSLTDVLPPHVPRDAIEPRPEGSGRVIARLLRMQAQQDCLDQIVAGTGRATEAAKEAEQPHLATSQELLAGLQLSLDHTTDQLFVGLDPR